MTRRRTTLGTSPSGARVHVGVVREEGAAEAGCERAPRTKAGHAQGQGQGQGSPSPRPTTVTRTARSKHARSPCHRPEGTRPLVAPHPRNHPPSLVVVPPRPLYPPRRLCPHHLQLSPPRPVSPPRLACLPLLTPQPLTYSRSASLHSAPPSFARSMPRPSPSVRHSPLQLSSCRPCRPLRHLDVPTRAPRSPH